MSDNWKTVGVSLAAGAAIAGMMSYGISETKKKANKGMDNPVIGYHKIRGLGAPLRMMCFFAEQPFTNQEYGSDFKATWFGKRKPELAVKNSCINLPYIEDGDTVVTQSNTCLLYLGQKLGIDRPEDFVHNHTVLDQTMDLRMTS